MIPLAKTIADLFIPHHPNYRDSRKWRVKHRDGKYINCQATNLEWEWYVPVAFQSISKRERDGRVFFNPFKKRTGETILILHASGTKYDDIVKKFPKSNYNQVVRLCMGRYGKWNKNGI
jgi:hypothetical protein